MSDDGRNILKAVRAIRRLFGDISLLLQTADIPMAEGGWKPKENQAVRYAGILSYGSDLMPCEIFRVYGSDSAPHLETMISVILDDRTDSGLLDEPLIATMLFDYGVSEKVKGGWNAEYAGWHLAIPGRRDDGVAVSADATTFPTICGYNVRARHKIRKLTSMAVPLTDIADEHALRNKIVAPLLKTLREQN
jgi:hypothetical protein